MDNKNLVIIVLSIIFFIFLVIIISNIGSNNSGATGWVIKTTTKCYFDSDFGINYLVKGYINTSSGKKSDVCTMNNTYVQEWYCANTGSGLAAAYETKNCSLVQGSNGICSDGKCMPVPCLDNCTMGQITCQGNGYEVCGNYDQDSCLEFGDIVQCNLGQICVDGVGCIDTFCFDEDNGINYTIASYVNATNGFYLDECMLGSGNIPYQYNLSGKWLREFFCNTFNLADHVNYYNCTKGCFNGACII